jgi:hypothetical protein
VCVNNLTPGNEGTPVFPDTVYSIRYLTGNITRVLALGESSNEFIPDGLSHIIADGN